MITLGEVSTVVSLVTTAITAMGFIFWVKFELSRVAMENKQIKEEINKLEATSMKYRKDLHQRINEVEDKHNTINITLEAIKTTLTHQQELLREIREQLKTN